MYVVVLALAIWARLVAKAGDPEEVEDFEKACSDVLWVLEESLHQSLAAVIEGAPTSNAALAKTGGTGEAGAKVTGKRSKRRGNEENEPSLRRPKR